MHIGYLIEDNNGTPFAAAETWVECLSLTLARVCQFYSGDVYGLMLSEMDIQQRDITNEEADKLNAIVQEWLAGVNEKDLTASSD